jgi:hypothetical protein
MAPKNIAIMFLLERERPSIFVHTNKIRKVKKSKVEKNILSRR